jgi:energy-converting hydrogenase Eha subunit C
MTWEQWKKILKGAMIAFLSAGITAALQSVAEMDFGARTALVQAVIAVMLNVLKVAAKL